MVYQKINNDETKKEEIKLELGYGLIPLVEKDSDSGLLDLIKKLRAESLNMPVVRITDNLALKASQYRILWNKNEVDFDIANYDTTKEKATKIIESIKEVYQDSN